MTNTAAVKGDDPEAIERKKRSERILASEGVPINTTLALIQPSSDSRPRSNEEVAMRALCVLMTAMKAEGMDQPMVLRVIRRYALAAHFTPVEKEFIRNATPTEDEKATVSSKYEAAWALLWALGYIDALSIPNQTCDIVRAVACMRDRNNTQSFMNDAKLRPLSQLLDQADLIFRYHWSVTDAEQNQRDIPAGLQANVVNQRLGALSWLIRYTDKEWDDFSVDS
jgi:hypothetical protein